VIYKVFVKKNGKWKKYSEHHNYDHAEINAKLQFRTGLETKITCNDTVLLHFKKEAR